MGHTGISLDVLGYQSDDVGWDNRMGQWGGTNGRAKRATSSVQFPNPDNIAYVFLLHCNSDKVLTPMLMKCLALLKSGAQTNNQTDQSGI